MDGALTVFKLQISGLGKEELITLCVSLKSDAMEAALRLEEYQGVSEKLARGYKEMEADLEAARKENAGLKALLRHTEDKNTLRTRDLFGRSSEKLSGLMDAAPAEDPIAEDAPEGVGGADSAEDRPARENRTAPPRQPGGGKKERKERRTRAEVLGGLPSYDHYEIDVEKLDSEHGADGWKILAWERCTTVGHVKGFDYADNAYFPVITYKQHPSAGHALMRPDSPARHRLWQKSYASSSLVADIIFAKAVLYLPSYRTAKDRERAGFPISEQVMCQWTVRAAEEFFSPVYEGLCDVVRADRYQQGDETTLTVIDDGRKAGSTCYVWLHCTGVYSDGPAAAVYAVELTRGAGHLDTFYANAKTAVFFYKTCDAYSGYRAFESENEGMCLLTGCFMHARRRWADAVSVLPAKTLAAAEDPESFDEVKALRLIGDIYKAEKELAGMTAEERHEKRKATTAPAVDAYFDFIKGLDLSSPAMGERARDAASYSINQEAYLRRFLDDGHLPCDNGFSERLIKPLAIGRRNWLFHKTLRGARAGCIIQSLAQTAILHRADPYYYFKYLLEKMPAVMEAADLHGALPDTEETRKALGQMMPWSEPYRSYECSEKKALLGRLNSSLKKEPPTIGRGARKQAELKAG